jgi:hypothetical protein
MRSVFRLLDRVQLVDSLRRAVSVLVKGHLSCHDLPPNVGAGVVLGSSGTLLQLLRHRCKESDELVDERSLEVGFRAYASSSFRVLVSSRSRSWIHRRRSLLRAATRRSFVLTWRGAARADATT